MEGLLQFLMAYMFIFLIIIIVIYIAVGIFLNKLNKLIYGKGTPMAFIPLVNTYLLGKLTVGKPVGLVLVFAMLLTGTFTTNVNGVENTYTLFSADTSSKISTIVNIVTFGLFIYAIFLYFKLKKEKNNGSYVDNKGPLDNNKTDVISNIISSSRDNSQNTVVNTEQNLNTSVNNNVRDVSDNNTVVNTTNNSNETSEFMKQYQSDDNNN